MIFIEDLLVCRHVGEDGDRPRALDRMRELALVASTTARDTPGNDLSAFRHEVAEATDVLVVDEVDLVRAEFADLPPTESAAFDRLLRRGNS
jgi:hypothetical protein